MTTLPPAASPAPDLSAQPGFSSWLRFALLWLVLGGLAYPALTTVTAHTLFPRQANGSLLTKNGRVVGSALVGQPFRGEAYFIGRPSAAGTGYDPVNVSGSNLAVSNPALRERVQAAAQAIAAREGVTPGQIPADLLTASGSGIDPHISPAGADLQVARVARARGLDAAQVRALVTQATERAPLGLGQRGVNVLRLNLALDALAPAAQPGQAP
ncbi:potassium-transporting ATPase subunit KdpC [Deinococcus arcticus]|uniref:Potassium-transporting ATPase KdpC subunit n=1 Tax=Deinococcus arcticus TaxID=2136176 RepID=A0A2T3WB58_9DEIO|nr:potassium-transporting ATPase subunit KdpC [Deinococcus arcticus]PTA69077.1 potassium-transporting ATPase subunit C [Deinococcus arcticus]